MDTFLIICGIILILVGIAGCIVPFLPGPPLVYGSLILMELTPSQPFTADFLIIWAIVTVVVLLVDYYVPIWGTKRFGGTKGGTWGATIGMILGIFFFPPIGIILGPFIGAFIGEIILGKDTAKALRSAVGSFIGFIAGTAMKLGVSIIMAFYFFRELF